MGAVPTVADRMAYGWGDAVSGVGEFRKAWWGVDIVCVVIETDGLGVGMDSGRPNWESQGEVTYL